MKLCRFAFLPVFCCALLQAQTSGRSQASISGTVRSYDGKALDDVHVTFIDPGTGATAASAYTNSQGVFEVSGLKGAEYEIIADSGVLQSRNRVDTRTADGTITLRMPPAAAAMHRGLDTGTISVAEYKVPKKARDAFDKANKSVAKNQMEEADKHIEEALNIYPVYSDALTLRAIRRLDKNKADAAIEDLDQAIKTDSTNARAYLVMASAFNLQKKYDDALRILDRASALAPTAWQGYYEMAKAHSGKAEYDAALRWLTKAQDLAPQTYAALYITKAAVLVDLKKYDAATRELETFLTKSPSDPQATRARAMLDKVKIYASR